MKDGHGAELDILAPKARRRAAYIWCEIEMKFCEERIENVGAHLVKNGSCRRFIREISVSPFSRDTSQNRSKTTSRQHAITRMRDPTTGGRVRGRDPYAIVSCDQGPQPIYVVRVQCQYVSMKHPQCRVKGRRGRSKPNLRSIAGSQ